MRRDALIDGDAGDQPLAAPITQPVMQSRNDILGSDAFEHSLRDASEGRPRGLKLSQRQMLWLINGLKLADPFGIAPQTPNTGMTGAGRIDIHTITSVQLLPTTNRPVR